MFLKPRRGVLSCLSQLGSLTVLVLGMLFASAVKASEPGTLESALPLLTERAFAKKAEAIDRIAESGDPRASKILNAVLEGQVYYRKADKRLTYAEKDGRKYKLTDVLTDESLGTVSRRTAKKVSINNTLRGQLRGAIAKLELSDPDPAVRLAAVNAMLDKLDEDRAETLEQFAEKEQNAKVREAMSVAVAVWAFGDSDKSARLKAIEAVNGALHPSIRNGLTHLAENDEDKEVRRRAQGALDRIASKVKLYYLAEIAFFGISLGSVLVLAAIGLAITFGVMGVINMAHGELIMLGAYTTYVIQQALPNHIESSLFIAVPAAFLVSGAVGIAIERGVIRFLYGRPLETLLATFGISLILQQAVRTIFSPLNRSVETPAWMSGSLQINEVFSLTLNRLYIVAFCLLVFAVLSLILKRTPLGLQVRAVSQNRPMARAMGVRSEWVDALTFGLGAGIAGVAGVALSQLTNVGPNLGQAYIVDSFMVVVFGGVGNLWGTLVGGLLLGVANKFLEPWSGAVLAKILMLVFIILFIQKRPRGLFPQKGRAAEA